MDRPTTLTTTAVEQPTSHRRLERLALVRLPGRNMEGNDGTVFVTNQMDLGGKAAARAPQRMVKRLLHLRLLTPSQPLRTPVALSGSASLFSPLQRPLYWLG
jgi:hypothetical protein